jgi:hypothetical protein
MKLKCWLQEGGAIDADQDKDEPFASRYSVRQRRQVPAAACLYMCF